MNNEPVLLHLHIPKAGGKTLQTIIYGNYANGSEEPEESGCLVNGIYWYPIGFEPESYTVPREEVFSALRRRDNIRVVSGHFPFGIHHAIPRSCNYITVLRDPVARVGSLYHHVRRCNYNTGSIHEQVANLSLDEFVTKCQYRPVDNGQVRLLSGQEPDFGECNEEMLKNAKNNLLNEFTVVGTLERFNETVRLLAHKLSWDLGEREYARKHVNPLGHQDLTMKTRALIHRYNELDVELYEYAEELLDDMLDRCKLD